MTDPRIERIAREVTKRLMDEGRIIEAGWVGLKLILERDGELPPVQASEMRFAFMSGAYHLFSSVMSALDPDAEPTDADMRKMDRINAELERFKKEIELRAAKAEGRA